MFEEYVKQSREQLRQRFGETGVKYDCANYDKVNGINYCKACSTEQRRRSNFLNCQICVCYFYEPKGKESDDGNE